MAAFRVGLTGGLASGKSLVARHLEAAGYLVIDADRIVAELYAPGAPGSAAVASLFGARLLGTDGGVDKAALASLVFSDSDARQRLEAAIHPLVRSEFARRAQIAGVAVLEATRLVEAGFAPDFDLVVTVEASPEARLERAVARGLSHEDAARRLVAQGDGEARRRAASWRIDNAGSLDGLRDACDRLVAEIERRSGSSRPSSPSGSEGDRAQRRARGPADR